MTGEQRASIGPLPTASRLIARRGPALVSGTLAALLVATLASVPWWLGPLGLTAAILLQWNALVERVPLWPTDNVTLDALVALVPADRPCRFVDLGCGGGRVVRAIARARPLARCEGVETSPLVWLWAWLATRLFGPPGCRIRYRSIWEVDLGTVDLAYAFLSNAPMRRLVDKARQELLPGAVLVSCAFRGGAAWPDGHVVVPGALHGPLWLWKGRTRLPLPLPTELARARLGRSWTALARSLRGGVVDAAARGVDSPAMRSETLNLALPDQPPVTLHWLEHGSPGAARTIVCVHGLTRNAHDFDRLARVLADHDARVLAVDVVGRGGSSWLADPAHYAVPVYAAQLHAWLAALGLSRVDWIGTSMGGLIGMALAALPETPIERLVLNDVGAFIPKEALAGIAAYLGLELRFGDLEAAERHLRTIHASFGDRLDDDWWRDLARHSVRPDGDHLRLHYDPAIRTAFQAGYGADIDLWSLWEAVRCPTLLLRGANSILLTADTAARMTTTGPRARLVTFPACGHAPALADPDQIDTIVSWLELD